MPVYVIGYSVNEVYALLPDASLASRCSPPTFTVVVRCGSYCRRLVAAGRGVFGEQHFDAGGCFLADIPAGTFRRAALQLEILEGRGRLLGSCYARLAKIQALPKHCDAAMELPLRGASARTRVGALRLGVFCLGPGDAALSPAWRHQLFIQKEAETLLLEKIGMGMQNQEDEPAGAVGTKPWFTKPVVPSKWVRGRLDLAVVGFWDLTSPELRAAPPRLAFRVEASQGCEEELLLLGVQQPVSQAKPKAWQTRRGSSFEVLRNYSLDLELPIERKSAQLVVTALRPDGEDEEGALAEARLPLAIYWPWIPESLPISHFSETQGVRRCFGDIPFEASVHPFDAFGKVPLLPPGASPDARFAVPKGTEIDPFGVPGSLGIIKCAYKMVKVAEPQADEGQERAEEAEVLEVEEEQEADSDAEADISNNPLGDSAARHTHNLGYSKWEKFDVDAELERLGERPSPGELLLQGKRVRAQARPTSERWIAGKMEEEREEDICFSLEEHCAGSKLQPCYEASRSKTFTLQLYVHRGFILLPQGHHNIAKDTLALDDGAIPQTYLEVFLGSTLVDSLRDRPAEGCSPVFRYSKALQVRLPEQAQLELRLRARGEGGAADPMLGSTVVDLQERWHCRETLIVQARSKNLPLECRTLWSPAVAPLRAVGSLQLWARLDDPEDKDSCLKDGSWPPELWPIEQPRKEVEVRVVLHEIQQLSLPGMGGDVNATLGLNLPYQRILGYRQPPLQFTDDHSNLRAESATAQFQWRAVFSHVCAPNQQVALLLAVHDRRRGVLLGRGNIMLDEYLADAVSGEEGRSKAEKLETDILDLHGRFRGRALLSLVVLPQELADAHPALSGRAAAPSPRGVEPEALAAQELPCPTKGRRPRDTVAAFAKKRSRGILTLATALLLTSALGLRLPRPSRWSHHARGLCVPLRAPLSPSPRLHAPRRTKRPVW